MNKKCRKMVSKKEKQAKGKNLKENAVSCEQSEFFPNQCGDIKNMRLKLRQSVRKIYNKCV